jgi:cell division protein FtsB
MEEIATHMSRLEAENISLSVKVAELTAQVEKLQDDLP